jgi:hypothetical protein
MLYEHTVYMSHCWRSGTVLDTPDLLVSILNLTTLYCSYLIPNLTLYASNVYN